MRYNLILFVALISAMAGLSCKNKSGGKYIDQGEIHYNIDYIGNLGAMHKEVMPRNLVVSFKKDKILFEMLGMGNSGIINLINPEKGIYDAYFSLFTIKYFYAAKPGEMYPGFEAMDGISIKKTSKTMVICGFNCKNAEVTFPANRNKIYEIWYTNEIDVKNTNASTPFSPIDGVLMNFFFFMGKAEVHFEAETVYKKDIPDDTFERRENFKRVTKENFMTVVNQMRSL